MYSKGILSTNQAFWHDATKTVRVAEFYDNTCMDLLESMVIQVSLNFLFFVIFFLPAPVLALQKVAMPWPALPCPALPCPALPCFLYSTVLTLLY
jgi:hypothetical protein